MNDLSLEEAGRGLAGSTGARWFALGVGPACLLDIAVKYSVWSSRPDLFSDSLLGVVQFRFHQNTGLMLGVGNAVDERYRALVLAAISALVLAGLAIFLLRRGFSRKSLALAWGVVIGSGLANLIERVTRGAVTDFLQLDLGWMQSGIFNLADLLNLCGLLFIAAMVLFRGRAL